jgi:hypothetical protein
MVHFNELLIISFSSFFADYMDLNLVRNVPVIHATDSWGLLVEHKRGWRVIFSGDTRPTRSLIELNGDKQCDLVIYEVRIDWPTQREHAMIYFKGNNERQRPGLGDQEEPFHHF